MRKLSKHICDITKYIDLGLALGLQQQMIDRLRAEHPESIDISAYQLLLHWREEEQQLQRGDELIKQQLAVALADVGIARVAVELGVFTPADK